MMRALARWLIGRSPRERLLLAALVLIVGPAALWFLWWLPLTEARDRAQAELAEAEVLHRWVVERDAELRAAVGGAGAEDPPEGATGIASLERSLRDAGLRDSVRSLQEAPNGDVTLVFEPTAFIQIADFAEALGLLGYTIDQMRIEATDSPSEVTASFDLTPGAGRRR